MAELYEAQVHGKVALNWDLNLKQCGVPVIVERCHLMNIDRRQKYPGLGMMVYAV